MKYALGLTAAVALMLAAPIDRPAAQTSSQPAAVEATKEPIKLSEQDKAAVIKAAVAAKSHQKTPEGFTPTVGASVPRTLYVHAFNPEITGQVPALKDYLYSYLDRDVVVIDGIQEKVVAVIPLPAEYMPGARVHQGAAEPESEPKNKDAASTTGQNKDGATTTGSVPAYTSPETTR
jgi:hypothetical protein